MIVMGTNPIPVVAVGNILMKMVICVCIEGKVLLSCLNSAQVLHMRNYVVFKVT